MLYISLLCIQTVWGITYTPQRCLINYLLHLHFTVYFHPIKLSRNNSFVIMRLVFFYYLNIHGSIFIINTFYYFATNNLSFISLSVSSGFISLLPVTVHRSEPALARECCVHIHRGCDSRHQSSSWLISKRQSLTDEELWAAALSQYNLIVMHYWAHCNNHPSSSGLLLLPIIIFCNSWNQ